MSRKPSDPASNAQLNDIRRVQKLLHLELHRFRVQLAYFRQLLDRVPSPSQVMLRLHFNVLE